MSLLTACAPAPTTPQYPVKPGTWELSMDIDNAQIPLRFEIDKTLNVTIINHTERIFIDSVSLVNDTIHITMPRYNSEFIGIVSADSLISGQWYNYDKQDYSIPFTARFKTDKIHLENDPKGGTELKYFATFSPNTEDEYPAIGVFRDYGNGDLTGTFLTETGDYRFLQGTKNDNQLTLSCFDGAHMFLFRGTMKGDSIVNGLFNSGKHYEDQWVAALDPFAELTDPDSLTYLVSNPEEISFEVMDLSGEFASFSNDDYLGRVTIIQIFGSWCPNCYDENEFYKLLHDTYAKQGFQVIPVAFESSDDFARNAEAVKSQFKAIGITYPAYLGGKASKTIASETFPMLNKVISFPTSIYLDKMGKVRKIHTGFYGPGTGDYYVNYVSETTAFIEELLAE
jgi:thiol-disulfide isomerase/thioredoxin